MSWRCDGILSQGEIGAGDGDCASSTQKMIFQMEDGDSI